MKRVNCSDFAAEVSNLLDGDVDPALRAHLEAHLAECKTCQVIYDSTRKTIRIVADSDTFELSGTQLRAGVQSIMARIRAMDKET